jgi:hypothetical protein
MISAFKYLLPYLLLCSGLALNANHNYNYSQVHELALISEPLFQPTRPVPHAQAQAHMPSLLEYSQLKKYQLRDTEYRAEEHSLSPADHLLLFNMHPPSGVFGS